MDSQNCLFHHVWLQWPTEGNGDPNDTYFVPFLVGSKDLPVIFYEFKRLLPIC